MTSSSGYTLLEALIVMTVLSLGAFVGTAALPNLGERNALARTDAKIQELLTDARTLARRTGIAQQVVFDMNARRIKMDPSRAWHELDRRIAISIVSAQEINVGSYPAILFLPDGTSSGATLTLASGEQRIVRHIDWLSGRMQRVPD